MTAAWVTYHCRVREADVPMVEKCLEQAGAHSVSCKAADNDCLRVDTLDGSRPLWPICDVSALFDLDADFAGLERRLAAGAIVALQDPTTTVHDGDWHEAWRDQFKPQLFGGGLWVCPTWCEPPASAKFVVRIDPGMAFGTGRHATTAMCLEWLSASDALAGAKVLDYGCGSGILAIAAAKLGAAAVVAVDIDPSALCVCRDNVELNSLEQIVVADPVILGGQRFDLIVANILLNPLNALAGQFAALLAPGGRIVLSGILRAQAGRLLAAYSSKFKIHTRRQLEEWALLAGVRD